ncbi:hypothetical protein HK105_203346 [Polyrhizophydium stewartii]|uniref:Uncharacterized protein n=1 Tax=Polyrhizophydium stewartii TaxID=2732419 RepID=A0ABR4NCW7_9FUNG
MHRLMVESLRQMQAHGVFLTMLSAARDLAADAADNDAADDTADADSQLTGARHAVPDPLAELSARISDFASGAEFVAAAEAAIARLAAASQTPASATRGVLALLRNLEAAYFPTDAARGLRRAAAAAVVSSVAAAPQRKPRRSAQPPAPPSPESLESGQTTADSVDTPQPPRPAKRRRSADGAAPALLVSSGTDSDESAVSVASASPVLLPEVSVAAGTTRKRRLAPMQLDDARLPSPTATPRPAADASAASKQPSAEPEESPAGTASGSEASDWEQGPRPSARRASARRVSDATAPRATARARAAKKQQQPQQPQRVQAAAGAKARSRR